MTPRFPLVCSIALLACLALAIVWACVPGVLPAMWGVEDSPSAHLVGRRSAALFLGLAWLMIAVRSAPPSRLRTAVADATALACAALAALGLTELLAGNAGLGILSAVSFELGLAWALSRSVRQGAACAQTAPWASAPPAGSEIEPLAADAHFQDAWSVHAADPALDALGQFARAARDAPGWVDAAMRMRNRIVSPFGLKDLGVLSAVDPAVCAEAHRPGVRIGVFTLRSRRADEVLLEDRDAHLDVVVSVHRRASPGSGTAVVTVTTVVRTHNLLGRLYMMPVRPMHRIIVRAMLRRIGVRRAPTAR